MAGSSYSIGGMSGIHGTIVCPYNTSHIVGVSRMQQHLYKCRKNNPEMAKTIDICPYNQSHHVSVKDMSMHLIVCPEYREHIVQVETRRGTHLYEPTLTPNPDHRSVSAKEFDNVSTQRENVAAEFASPADFSLMKPDEQDDKEWK